MRKFLSSSLLVLLAALPSFADNYDYIVTNKVGNIDIEYTWKLNVDYVRGTATLKSVSPMLIGTVEIPGVIALKNATSQYVFIVSELADNAFENQLAMTSVTVPSYVKRIGTACFANCSNLSAITIPYGVTTIGSRAFTGTIIQKIDLPDTVLNLEGNIAAGAPFDLGNTLSDSSHFTVTEEGAVYNKDQTRLYACPTRHEGALVMPESLRTIGEDAFYGCFRLTYLDIPATVTAIGAGAFNVTGNWSMDTAPESTPKLNKIFFHSDTPPTADSTAFVGAPADAAEDTLIYVLATDPNWPTSWCGRKVSVANASNPPTLAYIDAYNVTWKYRIVNNEAELITISPKSTSGHAIRESEEATTSRTALIVPDAINGFPVTRICSNAFENCTALVRLGLPETLTQIDDSAFKGCTHLTVINKSSLVPWQAPENAAALPTGITKLGRRVFEDTPILTLSIPYTLTEMAGNPVAGCPYITSIEIDASNPAYTLQDGILYNYLKTTLVGVPSNAKLTEFTVDSSVKTLADDAFYGCTALQKLTLPVGVTTLGDNALANCANLTSVTFCGDEPTADDSLYAGSSADLVTHCTEGFAGWGGTMWKLRKLDIAAADASTPSVVTQVVNGVTFLARSDPSGMVIVGMSGYGEEITIPRTLADRLVTALDVNALQSISGVKSFVSETPEIVVRNGCLYTADLTTLLRVPDAFTFTHTVVVTNTTYQRTVTTESAVRNGTIEYVGKVTADNTSRLSTLTSSFEQAGTASIDSLLPESVTTIGSYAFYGCRGLTGTRNVTTNSAVSKVESDTTNGSVTRMIKDINYSVITTNHVFLTQLPAHVTSVATTAFDGNAAEFGVNTMSDPVIGDSYQTPAAVFNVADSKTPIVYPTAPQLNGTIGSQTIVYRGVSVTVPDYYTASQTGCQINLTLNDNARSDPTAFTLTSDGNGIVFDLSNVRPDLYYSVKSQDTLGGEWHYVSNARRGDTLANSKIELTRQGNSGFYTVEVTDVKP